MDGWLWCAWRRVTRLGTDQRRQDGMGKSARELGVRSIKRASLGVMRALAIVREVLQVREHMGISAHLPEYQG
jgi:hypothetical protein